MSIQSLSYEQTVDILTGPHDIPADVTGRVETMLTEETPIVDIDRFSEFVVGLTVEAPNDTTAAIEANYSSVVMLGSCSIEMAWQQAGDIAIPRPRRLHEHNQSVLNTFDRVFAAQFIDPRDRLLRPMFAFQDGGKAHCVALATIADPSDPIKSRNQAVHNYRFAENVFGHLPNDVLSQEEKTVAILLIQQTAIGTALYRHAEKGIPLDEVVSAAAAELNRLREQCPPEYRDRFDDYLLVSYLTDAGAHTQRARYTDAATGEVRPDVMPEGRFNPDGTDAMRTLDRLFSEAPDDMNTLKLYQPKHLAVMRRLFPNHYE
jgi:hypothetical protein